MSFTALRKAPVFVLGVLAIIALQAMGGWWLDSGQRVLRACAVLFAFGVFMGVWRSEGTWVRACALWAGAIAGSTGVLFWTGPGNLWPLVLAFAAAISAAAVFAGTVFGLGVNKLRRS
jgi:hypothetical protein